MEKGTRNILILVCVVGAGLTALYFITKNKGGGKQHTAGVTAENKQKKITFTRS